MFGSFARELPGRPELRRARAALAAATCALVAASIPSPGRAQTPPFQGFLCCNMQSDGSWISDINYRAEGKKLVHAGTPVKVTGFGRWRVLVEIGGQSLAIGNDYSRSMSMEEFARRYVVAEDPSPRVQSAPAKVREAIQAAKVTRGMTREQVLLAIGYPITSYNEKLDAPIWRYWLDRSSEYQVFWGADGHVERVFGAPAVRAKVALE